MSSCTIEGALLDQCSSLSHQLLKTWHQALQIWRQDVLRHETTQWRGTASVSKLLGVGNGVLVSENL